MRKVFARIQDALCALCCLSSAMEEYPENKEIPMLNLLPQSWACEQKGSIKQVFASIAEVTKFPHSLALRRCSCYRKDLFKAVLILKSYFKDAIVSLRWLEKGKLRTALLVIDWQCAEILCISESLFKQLAARKGFPILARKVEAALVRLRLLFLIWQAHPEPIPPSE